VCVRTTIASVLASTLAVAALTAQTPDSSAAHREAGAAAAGQDHLALLRTVCPDPNRVRTTTAAGRGGAGANGAAGAATGGTAAATPRLPPDPSRWHAEPVKVFDNLYWVGQTEYSAWAITTSAGIIVIDTIFDYSVEDEVVEGLKKLGLDPADIKYVIVSHGHSDHSGGARLLQDRFHAHVLMSAADWDLLDRSRGTKPTRDMVVTDGQTLTLGDTTLKLYLTPGHTPGTISTIFPVTDHGEPHIVAEWGGTAFNFSVTPDRDREYWFHQYIASALRFRALVKAAGADVMIANHTNFDGSKQKLPALANRQPGHPNPWVIGTDAAVRYMTVNVECSEAGLAQLQGR
jgi:metallo-beta-lactamase class B